jgi:Aromatic acid exporter family member 1
VAAPLADDELMARGWRAALRRFGAELVLRTRERGRTAVFRAARITGATVAAFVIAELVGLNNPPPLVAALTAVLVVQATLASTLVNGVQRVLSVVAGVLLAVVLVSVVGLTWWSLGAIVAASILVGQILRLGPHLLEVPISAMLVLGVGYATAAETMGIGRVIETLVGAAVGVLVNVAFPPAVQTRFAGQAVEKFAAEIARLLDTAATALGAGPVEVDDAARWLGDARRLNRHAPQVDRALTEAEESRRLNVRALNIPRGERSLREGLDALEHASVSMRTLFRALYDATLERTGVEDDPEYADEVRGRVGGLMAGIGAVVLAFGRLLRAQLETTGAEEGYELRRALDELRRRRAAADALLLGDPRGQHGLWELNSAVLASTDRALQELDPEQYARVQEAVSRHLTEDAVERLLTYSVDLTKRVDLRKRRRRRTTAR